MGPTPTPQSHYKVTMDGTFRPMAPVDARRCLCSEVALHDPSRTIMSEQALVYSLGQLRGVQTTAGATADEVFDSMCLPAYVDLPA